MRFIIVKEKLLGRVITLHLVYAPNTEQRAFLNAFVPFLTFLSEDLITEGDLNLILKPTVISDHRREESNSHGPYWKQNLFQLGVYESWMMGKPPAKNYLFYSHLPLLFIQMPSISLSTHFKDFLTITDGGQLIQSVPIPVMTTHRHWLGSRSHSSWEWHNAFFNEFAAWGAIISKSKIYLNDDKNGKLAPNTICGTYKAGLRGNLLQTISTIGRERHAEHRLLLSEIKNIILHKNIGERKNLKKSISLWGLLHASLLEETENMFYQFRQKYIEMGNKGHKYLAKMSTMIGMREQNSKLHYTGEAGFRVISDPMQNEWEGGKSVSLSGKGCCPDRFSIELYMSLMGHFLCKLTNLLNIIQDFQTLANSRKEANIAVILKARSDKTEVTTHRHISLLNTEFKNFAKVLAANLESILLKITSIHQLGINQGRLLLDNFPRQLAVIPLILLKAKADILFSLEVEKVFNQGEWKLLKGIILEKPVKKCTEILLYKHSKPLLLHRGTWQIYPQLPILLVLIRKIFAQKLREDQPTQCLTANRSAHKTVLSVDALLMFTESLRSVAYVGFKINHSSTQATSICLKSPNENRLQLHLKWPKYHTKNMVVNIISNTITLYEAIGPHLLEKTKK